MTHLIYSVNGRRARVYADVPAIPIRRFDYCATFLDEYEPGDIIGRGATEVEALADLKEQDDERNEEMS